MKPPSHSPADHCWFLTGPTAGGKTSVGVELARQIGAEIISLDSMALYRGMDVGTAKPTAEERQAAPHHLIDVLKPYQDYSVAQYVDAAHAAIDDVKARGREVLFVGGTPLYLKALLRGIFRGPPADWDFRERLEEEAEKHDPDFLHRRLAQVDPAASERLHPNDTRRLIRALEVYEITGRPISELQRQFDKARSADACRVFVLDWPTAQLNARIDHRVDQMFASGLVGEVQGLLDSPHPLSKTASQAVGYREVIEHLQGVRGLPETIQRVKTRTRQFAKRQRTWFRSLSECRFVPVVDPIDPAAIACQIADIGLRGRAGS